MGQTLQFCGEYHKNVRMRSVLWLIPKQNIQLKLQSSSPFQDGTSLNHQGSTTMFHGSTTRRPPFSHGKTTIFTMFSFSIAHQTIGSLKIRQQNQALEATHMGIIQSTWEIWATILFVSTEVWNFSIHGKLWWKIITDKSWKIRLEGSRPSRFRATTGPPVGWFCTSPLVGFPRDENDYHGCQCEKTTSKIKGWHMLTPKTWHLSEFCTQTSSMNLKFSKRLAWRKPVLPGGLWANWDHDGQPVSQKGCSIGSPNIYPLIIYSHNLSLVNEIAMENHHL